MRKSGRTLTGVIAGILAASLGCSAVEKPQLCEPSTSKASESHPTYDSLVRALDKEFGVDASSPYSSKAPIILIPEYHHSQDQERSAQYIRRIAEVCARNNIQLSGIGLEGPVFGQEQRTFDLGYFSEKTDAAREIGIPVYGLEDDTHRQLSADLTARQLAILLSGERLSRPELDKAKQLSKESDHMIGLRSWDWVKHSAGYEQPVVIVGGALHIPTVREACEAYRIPLIIVNVQQNAFGRQ